MPEPVPALLHQGRQRFEQLLPDWLAQHAGQHDRLQAAIAYAMGNGGKRVRPALAWGACLAAGGDWPDADSAALAVECLHGYSLVHDDLPCMDDDDLRRGQPTCHRRFDEATALLAGDALQALAFVALSASALPADRRLQQVATLAAAAHAMVDGQSLDLAGEQQALTLAQLRRIHENKTGALIQAAVRLGALAAEASPAQLAALARFAGDIGLAFQVHDDILDVTGDTQKLGKTAGADAVLGKSTYPALMGLDSARRFATELTDTALAALAPLGERAQPLRELAVFLLARDH